MAVGSGVYRVTGRNEIFILENNKWRYVSTEAALFQAGYSWANVQIIPVEEWCPYEVGYPMPGGWADPNDYGYYPHKDWYVSACAVVPPPPVYTCPQCGATFSSQADLDVHIAEVHPLPVYTCPQCGATFGSQAELDDHILTVHPPPPPNGNGVPASIPMIAWPTSITKCTPAGLKVFTDLGINALMCYDHWWSAGFTTNPAYIASLNTWFDNAAAAGVKLYIYMNNRTGAYKGLYSLSADDGKPFITKFKHKPAIAGWFIADEPHCWHTFPGYTIPAGDRYLFPYLSNWSWPAGGHGQARMLYDMIRGQDPDIANHPAFAVWDKGFDHLCGDPPVWTSTYNLIYTPGGEILDVGSVDVYPGGDNWAMLDHNINLSYTFKNGDGFGQLGKGMIPVIDAWTDGAAASPDNLVNQCIHWESKYTRAMIKGVGFYTPATWLQNTPKGANLREQIKEVARFYGWQERADEVITEETIIHSCNVKISYQASSFAENNDALSCPNCGMALGVEGLRGSEEIIEVIEVITPHIITCAKCGSQLELSVSSIGEKNTEQFCPVCGEPAD